MAIESTSCGQLYLQCVSGLQALTGFPSCTLWLDGCFDQGQCPQLRADCAAGLGEACDLGASCPDFAGTVGGGSTTAPVGQAAAAAAARCDGFALGSVCAPKWAIYTGAALLGIVLLGTFGRRR